MPLSDISVRSAKPRDKAYKLYDTAGLFLLVTPSGGKWWRFKYRFEGKEKLISLGTYPAVGLKDARLRRNELKAQLADGIEPCRHRKACQTALRVQTENCFEVVAREWFAKQSLRWSESNRDKVLARLVNNIFPFIGSTPLQEITAPALLEIIRRIEQRGAVETAHRALQDCSRIFRYGIATGRVERDTAADLRGALSPAKGTNFASITEPAAVGSLLRAIDGYEGNIVTAFALRLSPYVFVRPGELRRAEWGEFNLQEAEWRIPPERMKMRRLHIVPLSRQALDVCDS